MILWVYGQLTYMSREAEKIMRQKMCSNFECSERFDDRNCYISFILDLSLKELCMTCTLIKFS